MLEKDIDRELANYLLECVLKKQYTLTYGEVAKELSFRLGRHVNPRNLGRPLGNVLELCYDLDLPLITALVRHKGTDAKTIGEGFYGLACELRPEYKEMSPLTIWKQELKQIRDCNEWNRLKNYLDGLVG